MVMENVQTTNLADLDLGRRPELKSAEFSFVHSPLPRYLRFWSRSIGDFQTHIGISSPGTVSQKSEHGGRRGMSSATTFSVDFIALDEACEQEVVGQNVHRVTRPPHRNREILSHLLRVRPSAPPPSTAARASRATARTPA